MKPIVLYDIPSNDPHNPVWSSNVWKTRLSLAYKGLPFTIEWIEFPDIEPFCKKLGLPPTGSAPNGSPIYTVPVIYDPNTGKHIVESTIIAKYLDQTYPQTPQLFPPGTDALQTVFVGELAQLATIAKPLYFLIMVPTEKKLNPRSAEFWRRTREERYGVKMEELATAGRWRALETSLHQLKIVLDNQGGFLGGDKIVLADVVIAADLLWAKAVDEEIWSKIANLDDGWWVKWLERFAPYTVPPRLQAETPRL